MENETKETKGFKREFRSLMHLPEKEAFSVAKTIGLSAGALTIALILIHLFL